MTCPPGTYKRGGQCLKTMGRKKASTPTLKGAQFTQFISARTKAVGTKRLERADLAQKAAARTANKASVTIHNSGPLKPNMSIAKIAGPSTGAHRIARKPRHPGDKWLTHDAHIDFTKIFGSLS